MKDKIDRLVRMLESDGGFYVLATHSFIEYYMRNNFPGYDNSWTITFNTNLYNYKKYLIEENPGQFLNELSCFKAIMDQRKIIDSVLYNFEAVSREEARAATFNFLQFSKATGIDERLLEELKKSLESWRRGKGERKVDIFELENIKNELFSLKKENRELLDQYRDFEETKAVKKYLESRIETLSLEIDLQRKNTDEKNQKIDELRQSQKDLEEDKKQVDIKISHYEQIDKYLKNLLRVTLYSRTRMDYERTLTELTGEQKDILKQITLKSDFLVKGGAGTGKTLVLLEAMKEVNRGTLEFANKKLLLLTYTNTLVKYDRYISEIMEISDGNTLINTADSYINGIFEGIFPDFKIDYSILGKLCKEQNSSSFFDGKQLYMEIEDFLYGYNISEKEYIQGMIVRRGMKTKLTRLQRQEVWNIKSSIEELMVKSRTISKGYSRVLIFNNLNDDIMLEKQEFDHIFIDESQDLFPIELQLLKDLSLSSLVMAGDTDQSIYGIGSPYNRAGISTIGTTKILKTNFRNTIPIHELAEKFRKRSTSGFDKSITPAAFREGPIPELYSSPDTEELYNQLVEKVKIFVNTIEYDRENICILAPTARFLNKIQDRLETEGISSVNIKDPQFSFKSEGSIRLSPLHSSKGLDIPVVLLFIPILFYNKELDTGESEDLVRNLVYVSMTRAMENLNVFTKENSNDPIIGDLLELMN